MLFKVRLGFLKVGRDPQCGISPQGIIKAYPNYFVLLKNYGWGGFIGQKLKEMKAPFLLAEKRIYNSSYNNLQLLLPPN